MAKVTARKETGKLVIDFTYRSVRCREQTALSDTAPNRRRAAFVVQRIKAAIAAGSFDYAEHFPDSPLAQRFAAIGRTAISPHSTSLAASATASVVGPTPTFRDFTSTCPSARSNGAARTSRS